MKIRILASLFLLACALTGPHAIAETIAVIGTGNVGGALGPAFAAQGHTIVYGSREPGREDVMELVRRTGNGASARQPTQAVIDADIVVLAVPGTAALSIVNGLGDLSGKIILDPTNVISRDAGFPMHGLNGENSNAELIQAAQPDARVVKAFNTLNFMQMVDPESAGGPISIPLAGASAQAKAIIADLVEGMGLHAADVGPLAYSRVLEQMLAMWAYSVRSDNAYNFYLQPMP
jgi:predicted dinucleotide-binding enzyme